LAHGAFKKTMPKARNLGSDQFVEELILTVRGRRPGGFKVAKCDLEAHRVMV
jgi:hypothetical protein